MMVKINPGPRSKNIDALTPPLCGLSINNRLLEKIYGTT